MGQGWPDGSVEAPATKGAAVHTPRFRSEAKGEAAESKVAKAAKGRTAKRKRTTVVRSRLAAKKKGKTPKGSHEVFSEDDEAKHDENNAFA